MCGLNIFHNVSRIGGFFHLVIADRAYFMENICYKIELMVNWSLLLKTSQPYQAYFPSLKNLTSFCKSNKQENQLDGW